MPIPTLTSSQQKSAYKLLNLLGCPQEHLHRDFQTKRGISSVIAYVEFYGVFNSVCTFRFGSSKNSFSKLRSYYTCGSSKTTIDFKRREAAMKTKSFVIVAVDSSDINSTAHNAMHLAKLEIEQPLADSCAKLSGQTIDGILYTCMNSKFKLSGEAVKRQWSESVVYELRWSIRLFKDQEPLFKEFYGDDFSLSSYGNVAYVGSNNTPCHPIPAKQLTKGGNISSGQSLKKTNKNYPTHNIDFPSIFSENATRINLAGKRNDNAPFVQAVKEVGFHVLFQEQYATIKQVTNATSERDVRAAEQKQMGAVNRRRGGNKTLLLNGKNAVTTGETKIKWKASIKQAKEKFKKDEKLRNNSFKYKPPPRNTKWIQAEKDAFYEIINGKQFQDSLTGKTFRNGTWKWVHEAMARNTGWTWARTLKSLMKFYEKL